MCNGTFSRLDTQACYPGPCQGELLSCFPSLENSGNEHLPVQDYFSEISLHLPHNILLCALQNPLPCALFIYFEGIHPVGPFQLGQGWVWAQGMLWKPPAYIPAHL